jgi:hypothetical protein
MSPPTSRASGACAQAPSQTHNPPVSDETSPTPLDDIDGRGREFKLFYEGRFGDLVEEHAGGVKATCRSEVFCRRSPTWPPS